MNINSLLEIQKDYLDADTLCKLIDNKETIVLKGKNQDIAIGKSCTIKVNTNVGVPDLSLYENEIRKIDFLTNLPYKPDIMMDHTIIPLDKPLWKSLVDVFGGPVGTLPHYLTYRKNRGIDKSELFELIREMAEYGVSFMTLHPTADRDLLLIAEKTRTIPITSRGGGLILSDMILNDRNENIIAHNFIEILSILREFHMGVSIGTIFRPSNVFEALDEVHLLETKKQFEFIRIAKEQNIPVMMEGIGHITLKQLDLYADIIREHNVPFMPLGPIPTDATSGYDHISSAIGSAYLGKLGIAKVINSITREEHTGGVPTFDSIVEGLVSARIAAHIVDIDSIPKSNEIDRHVVNLRNANRSCIAGFSMFSNKEQFTNNPGCIRCNEECPLNII